MKHLHAPWCTSSLHRDHQAQRVGDISSEDELYRVGERAVFETVALVHDTIWTRSALSIELANSNSAHIEQEAKKQREPPSVVNIQGTRDGHLSNSSGVGLTGARFISVKLVPLHNQL
jgi:hypothetical protein